MMIVELKIDISNSSLKSCATLVILIISFLIKRSKVVLNVQYFECFGFEQNHI